MTADSPAPVVNDDAATTPEKPVPFVRAGIGGVLMGLANLVPGVSGGTMILVMGLYDEFITSVADITRLRFTRRNVLLLGTIGGAAAMAIVLFAGVLGRAVTLHTSAMFSLFIGLTLGGAPLLFRMIGRITPSVVVGMLVGLAAMTAIAVHREEPPDKVAIRESVAAGRYVITPMYARDVVAGTVAISAMVLPGISGAYMLLVLGRYEAILSAIDVAKRGVFSFGRDGDILLALRVIVPVGIGVILGLVVLANLLKWLLHHHEKPTLAVLQGVLLGSVIGLWPLDATSGGSDYATCAALALAGFGAALGLSRIKG